jgi:phosphopantetheinyl transferase
MEPEKYTMSEELAPGVAYYVNRSPHQQALIFVALRYLAGDELDKGESFAEWDNRLAFTVGRVALKDAIRRVLWPAGELPYPVEIGTVYDEAGRPSAVDRDGRPLREGLDVSLAHKPDRGVAIAADRRVGIDIEHIEVREQSFLDLAFAPAEQELLRAQGDAAEWATRFWVAKEAYGKMTGEGLRGNPKRYTVSGVEGEVITVEATRVSTRRLDDDYIVGWTIE